MGTGLAPAQVQLLPVAASLVDDDDDATPQPHATNPQPISTAAGCAGVDASACHDGSLAAAPGAVEDKDAARGVCAQTGEHVARATLAGGSAKTTETSVAESGWGVLLLGGGQARGLPPEIGASMAGGAGCEASHGGDDASVEEGSGQGGAGGCEGSEDAEAEDGVLVEILKERYVTIYLAFNEVRRWKGQVRVRVSSCGQRESEFARARERRRVCQVAGNVG